MNISERMTPARLRWLETLEVGPAKRTSSVGYHCMVLGWTEWDYRDPETGMPASIAELQERYGAKWTDSAAWWELRERLTDAGRAALNEARRAALSTVRTDR